MFKIKIIILLVIIIIYLFLNKKIVTNDNFIANNNSIKNINNQYNIDMYVISLRQNERLKNIKIQENKINRKIKIFDAIKGDLLDVNNLIKNNILEETFSKGPFYRKREVACYLSHFNIYNKIKVNNYDGYTIIFEDDFIIMIDNFMEKINKIINNIMLKNINFDILFLGNLNNNYGTPIEDIIYTVNTENEFTGCHGYLINNKNIDKIIENTKYIDRPIDTKLFDLLKMNKLNILVLYPIIVDQGGSCYSSITDINIENFTD